MNYSKKKKKAYESLGTLHQHHTHKDDPSLEHKDDALLDILVTQSSQRADYPVRDIILSHPHFIQRICDQEHTLSDWPREMNCVYLGDRMSTEK